MTTPPGSSRAELARRWADALRTTAYVPISCHESESLLRELLDSLFDTLTVKKFSPHPGRAVGQRLIAGYFTGGTEPEPHGGGARTRVTGQPGTAGR